VRKNGQLYAHTFIHTQGAVDLAHYGVLYDARKEPGNVLKALVPVSNLRSLAADPAVKYMEIGKPVKVKLDAARSATRVDEVHAGTGLASAYTGEGVVVGIIDIGMDYAHPTFFDQSGTANYRIKRVWDQNAEDGTTPANYDYGAEYTTQQSILDAAYDLPGDVPHATHVTGIAAGSGGGLASYVGVAPESEIVYVSISQADGSIADAAEYIFDYATSVNKPCVINMSLGIHEGPHDGNSTLDKAFDQLAGPGRLLVGSAGNEGDIPLHLQKVFSATNNQLYSFVLFPDNSVAGSTYVDIWGEPGQTFQVAVHVYNQETDEFEASTSLVSTSSDQALDFTLVDQDTEAGDETKVFIGTEASSENNNKPHAYITFDHSTQDDDFKPVLVEVRASSGTVHVWAEDPNMFTAGGKAAPFMDGNTSYTVGEIGGTGKSVITAGAYNTKKTWTALGGETVTQSYSLYEIADFSSQGPTVDGRIKPDITAPGNYVVSAISTFGNSIPGEFDDIFIAEVGAGGAGHYYGAFQGTSMASPMVAGTLALMLEANPSLTPTQARTLLSSGAITDTHTGTIPTAGSNTWGWGKLNAQASLQLLTGATSRAQADPSSSFLVFPNPSQGTLQVVLADGGSSAYSGYRLVNALGQTVSSQSIGISTGQFEIRGLPAGMYSLILDSATQSVAQKVVVQP
jgi:subtilisin family serine protease